MSRHAPSLATAARRHDDGWSVWERSPDVDLGEGRPLNVFDVGTEIHLAFLASYPFADPELALTLRRKVLPKQQWRSRHEFAAGYDAAPFEDRVIALRPG